GGSGGSSSRARSRSRGVSTASWWKPWRRSSAVWPIGSCSTASRCASAVTWPGPCDERPGRVEFPNSSRNEVLTVVQVAQSGQSSDVSPEQLAKIPPIVDLDAHLVEPPDIWEPRLPSKFREAGPHVEYHPNGEIVLQGASYIEAPGTEGPDVVWWNYEGKL